MAILEGLNRAMRKIRKATGDATRDIAEEIYIEVWNRTPVDTSALRANWNLTKESPDFTFDPNKRASSPNQSVPDIDPGDVVFLANGAPYARRIEFEGHSRQAPRGMLRLGVQAVVARRT